MICPHCGYDKIEPGALHCSQCGGHLGEYASAGDVASPTCPHCGNLLSSTDEDICPVCGLDIKDLKTIPAGTPGLAAGFLGRKISIIGGLMGLILSVLIIYLLAKIAVPESFTQKMFLPGGVLSIVPWTITFLFLWSVCVLILRIIRLISQRRHIQPKFTNRVENQLAKGEIHSAIKMLEGHTKTNILLNRLHQALYTWRIFGRIERVEDELQRQTEMDVDAAVGGYSEIRTFIWAMPVIGFIGTVIGISLAVGDFSGFLGGEIENIDLVKTHLMAVTNGLSFAFLTTLLGLLGALFIMLPASSLQKTEEDFYIGLDRRTRELVIPFMKSKSAQAQTGVSGAPGAISAQLVKALKDGLPAMSSMKEELSGFTKALLDKHSKHLTEANDAVLAKLTEGYDGLTNTTSKIAETVTNQIGQQLIEINGSILKELENLYKELMTKSIQEISDSAQAINKEMLQRISGESSRGLGRINEAADSNVGKMDRLVSDLGSKLTDLGKGLKKRPGEPDSKDDPDL